MEFMLNCIYKGESISSYIVRDEREYAKRKELAIEIREASRNGALTCEDCGHPVEFRCGEIRIPYFAHCDGFAHFCSYQEYFKKESKAHKMGKEILHRYFKELYPDANVRMEYRLENRRRANIYVEQNNQRLAVELERFDIDIQGWEQKHKDYKELGIADLWIICPNKNKTKFYDSERDLHIFKQVLLHELSNMLVFLDVSSEEIHLLKNIEYRNKKGDLIKDKIYIQKYKLSDILILLSGNIEFKSGKVFYNSYNNAKSAFIEECKAEEEKAKREAKRKHDEEQRRLQEQRIRELEEDRADNSSLYRRDEQTDIVKNDIKSIINRKRVENRYVKQTESSATKSSFEPDYQEPEENELLKKYAYRIQRAKNGDSYSLDYLVQGLHNGPKAYRLVKTSFKHYIDRHDSKAEELYIRVMKRAGFPID